MNALTLQGKVQCVLWLTTFESVTLVQCEYCQCLMRIHHSRSTFIVGINSLMSQKTYTIESVLVHHLLVTNQLTTLKIVSFAVLRNQFVNVVES